MNRINITTTQNVDIDYEPAGVGYRILATMLDEFFKFTYIMILMMIFGTVISNIKIVYDDTNYGLYAVIILASLPYLLYYFICETLMNGQSFGKKIIGTKVIKLDGSQPSFSSYLIRSLTRIIDRGLIAIIAVAATKKAQRLGDLAAGTTVVRLNAKVTLEETILYKPIKDYKIVFDQVSLLTDKNIAIVKHILDNSTITKRQENLALLTKKIKAKMGVTSELEDAEFLKTVLLDYSHYQFEN